MSLKGDLKNLGLEELIQAIQNGKKSGKLEIIGEIGIYGIFFENGQIIHAFAPFAIGLEAIKDAFLEINGHFSLIENLILPPRTIKKNNMSLLMDGIKAREECKNVLKYIKKDTIVSVFSDTNTDHIEAKEWKVLRYIIVNKRVTILDILEKTNLTYYNTCKALNNLLEKKLIIMEVANG